MKALVTGGAGFIGSNLVRLLISRGNDVCVLDNLSTGYRENLAGLSVTFINADIREKAAVDQAAASSDIIFHFAACVGNVRSLKDPQEDSEINIIGTLNILDAARHHRIKRIIYSSSAAIFGELKTLPISEDHPQHPDSPYGVSKLAGEQHILCFGRLYDITTICLRYFNVYGVNQRFDAYGNVIPIFVKRLLDNKPLTIYGDGDQTRDFVNVVDVAIANFLAATVPQKSGVYNIGSGTSITINALTELLQDGSGRRADSIIHSDPRPSEVRHCCANISKAKQQLGFTPTVNLTQGIKDYCTWFKANNIC